MLRILRVFLLFLLSFFSFVLLLFSKLHPVERKNHVFSFLFSFVSVSLSCRLETSHRIHQDATKAIGIATRTF